ncbi:MAG: hypothetical protein ACYC6G_04300 [Desulfobaccales bacterium]
MMDLEQAHKWRDLASKIGAAFCIIALMALVDGLLVHFREPANLVKVLPGTTIEINGELTDEAHGIEDLTFTTNADQLQVTFEAIHKGYFLGGDMWRGRLLVGTQISPGEYSLSVIPKRTVSPRKAPAFRIIVFPDALSLQKSSTSLIRRWFGISAFMVAAGCLPGILLAFGAVFLLSGKEDALLAAAGKAEIYRVTRTEDGFEVRFSLGSNHGVGPGSRLSILGADNSPLGTVEIEESSPTDSRGMVSTAGTDQEIKVGLMVSR